jgi:hypothetical protein
MSNDAWYKYKSERWFHDTLCYCPECMKFGYHSLYHQFVYNNDECFIHKVQLKKLCPECKKPIPYGLSGSSARTPFSCVCGYKLFDMPIEDAYFLWCNQDLINTKIRVCSEETSMAIIKPTSQSLMGISCNKLTNKISDLCNNQKCKSDYFFRIIKHNDFLPCYTVADNTEHSYYNIDLIYWKAIQVVERHIRRTLKIKLSSKKNKDITEINIDTVAYFLFVKFSEGVNNVQKIHSSYMKERRLHEYVGWWNDWGPKHILNELVHLDSLYTRYPKKMKMFIYHNIIYRINVLRLFQTFKLILKQVKIDFEGLNIQKDIKLDEYYNNFSKDIVDNTNYILELNNDYGNLWCINET